MMTKQDPGRSFWPRAVGGGIVLLMATSLGCMGTVEEAAPGAAGGKGETPISGAADPTMASDRRAFAPSGEVSANARAIADGTPAVFSPYAAAIKDATGLVTCSGTFISPRVVLTAAHCAWPQLAATVATGLDVNTAPHAVYTVTSHHRHPAYTITTPQVPAGTVYPLVGDVGVIVVSQPYVPFGDAIPGAFDPIEDKPVSYAGLSVTLVGYGMDRNPTGPADLGGRGIQRHTSTTVIAGSFGSNADIFYFDDASHSTRPHDSGGPSYIWRNGRRIVGIHGGFFPTNPGWAGYDTKAGIASYAQWVYTIARQIDPLPVVTMDYTWTAADGTDLDTRTAVVEPARFAPVGWAKAQTDGPAARPYLTWTSGDNQGTGSERVVADVASLAMDYPPTVASHVFYFGQAAFWYGSRAAGNVGLSVVTGPQQRTRTVNVTLQTTSGASNGQPIGTVTLDTWSRRLHIF